MSLASTASFAKMQSSFQERKESSASVSKTSIMGDQVVSSSQQSASKSSRSDSTTATGCLAIGQDGQAAIIAGAKVHQSSQQSHAESSSLTASSNGEVRHQSSSHSVSSSKKSSSSIMMTSSSSAAAACTAAVAANFPRSLLTLSQFDKCFNTFLPIEEVQKSLIHFEDLESLTAETHTNKVEAALVKYVSVLSNSVELMKGHNSKEIADTIGKINNMMVKAWEVPAIGHQIGYTLVDTLTKRGALDILINHCVAEEEDLKFQSAKLLQQCLVTSNRGYVVEKGLKKVISVAIEYIDKGSIHQIRIGTGILEHLFKHSETTCGDVIAMGGLDRVVSVCKSTDIEALRHCASALANVAIFGGNDNQEAMIQRKVPHWLFPLAFKKDDIIKYYACLAVAVLVANKELEAAVQKSGTLELIEPFVQTHTPAELSTLTATHSHGQSSEWLRRLIPVLLSNREEARNLAAFHFCMEAEIIQRQQDKSDLLRQIGCVDSLRKVASGPNGIASKYAGQTLRLIGEEVPHKLSQQVPTWSVQDVKEWIKQIGFPQYAESFEESRVDGDLLLQLSEEMLREDIEMRNGIMRRRFLRELTNLKKMADYSSCDPTNLNGFMQGLGNEYSVYTYEMLNAGIDRDTLMSINEEQLLCECGIKNKVHRLVKLRSQVF